MRQIERLTCVAGFCRCSPRKSHIQRRKPLKQTLILENRRVRSLTAAAVAEVRVLTRVTLDVR